MALHPRYTQTRVGRVFCYYLHTADGQDYAYVSEFTATDDVVDVTSERILLRVLQPFVRGNGGQVSGRRCVRLSASKGRIFFIRILPMAFCTTTSIDSSLKL